MTQPTNAPEPRHSRDRAVDRPKRAPAVSPEAFVERLLTSQPQAPRPAEVVTDPDVGRRTRRSRRPFRPFGSSPPLPPSRRALAARTAPRPVPHVSAAPSVLWVGLCIALAAAAGLAFGFLLADLAKQPSDRSGSRAQQRQLPAAAPTQVVVDRQTAAFFEVTSPMESLPVAASAPASPAVQTRTVEFSADPEPAPVQTSVSATAFRRVSDLKSNPYLAASAARTPPAMRVMQRVKDTKRNPYTRASLRPNPYR